VETHDGKIAMGIPSLGGSIILKIIMKVIRDVQILAGPPPHVYF
jgi:hypothetical protein